MTAGGRDWQADLADPLSIAIELDFDGAQPSHFGADPATQEPMTVGNFVGDTRQGGSCNARRLSLVPHCNGTHTESVGHITDEPFSVLSVAPAALLRTALISIEPEPASDGADSTIPAAHADDPLITQSAIAGALAAAGDPDIEALVIRTLPNPVSKKTLDYSVEPIPPYFTLDAIMHLVALDIRHLLTDTPSLDRIHDDGKLAAHRVFWGLRGSSHSLNDALRPSGTITELIYVPDEIVDGLYLLNLQLPAFVTDAAPSRPVLFRTELV